VIDTTDQFQSTSSIVVSNVPELSWVLGWDYRQSKPNIDPVAWPFFQGTTQRLLVQLDSASTGFHESASVQVKLDNTTGIPYLEQMLSQIQSQGGMTEQEHTWLDTTQQAVQRVFTDALGVLHSTPLGSLLSHPDMDLLDLPEPPFELRGRGELDHPPGSGRVDVYGLNLLLSQVPPGFGTRDGSVEVYNERLGQFVTMHSVKGTTSQWLTEVMDLHLATMLWLWRTPFPARILYDITPGCAVLAQWVWFKA
jgi:hypothetical protein